MERYFFIRVVQEQGLQWRDTAIFEINIIVIEIQHGVRRVSFATKSIVGQHPIGAVGHVFYARMTLQWLAGDWQTDSCWAIGRFTGDGAQCTHALTTGVFATLL